MPFITSKTKRLQEENTALKHRVQELEDILCPFSQHDWIIIDRTPVYYYKNTIIHLTYRCKKCGKVKEKISY